MIRITQDVNELFKVKDGRLSDNGKISLTVSRIIDDVKRRGDEALREYTFKFDGINLETFEITPTVEGVSDDYRAMLERSAANIRQFHSRQLREGFMFSPVKGVILGERIIPLERVGIYVPGGTASYPSTVLMNVIPAKTAGCNEIFIATPPPVKPEILAAAKISGADRIFTVGGAQAVAALAYGTGSIPKVDKITGPGNAYVAEAKRQVYGKVGIDMIAGPSEILIIADESSNAEYIASDLLAQAEHDKDAMPILVTVSRKLAETVRDELERQIVRLKRSEIARVSIDKNGIILIVNTLNEAVKVSNEIAPEHLELSVEKAFEVMTGIKNAGSIFIGSNTPEALGDYYAGINHTLPTMGTAKFSSPLSVDDFVKKSQYVYYSREELEEVSEDIEMFANSEGLTAHAESIAVRRRIAN